MNIKNMRIDRRLALGFGAVLLLLLGIISGFGI